MDESTKIKFVGLDDFCRPVFLVVGENYYIGSVNKLFDYQTDPEIIKEYFRENPRELRYFGENFNCEPIGTSLKRYKFTIE